MRLFFDTSALIKRYISETGSDKVDELFDIADQIVVSPISKIEAFSTIKRLQAEKAISIETYQSLIAEIGFDFLHFIVLPLSKQTEEMALKLIKAYQLKTLDSIQLASFISHQASIHQFVVSDSKLKKAANSEKINTIDPTDFD